MADIFGDADLFTEFDRHRPASDKILIQKLDDDFRTHGISNGSHLLGVGGTETFDSERRCYNDMPDCGETDSAECGENTDVVHSSKLRNLQNEVHRLTALNAELLKQNSLISLKRLPNIDEGPGLQVLFMNNHVSRKYKADIEAYISKLVTRELAVSSSDAHNSTPRLPWRPNFVSLASSTHDSADQSTSQSSHSKLVIGSCQFYGGFIIDPLGWPLIEYNPALSDGWLIPTYQQVFHDVLPCDLDDDDDLANQNAKPPKRAKYERVKRTCFNCGGDHELSACKERRNMQRIDENRRQFYQHKLSAGKVPQGKQTSRYQADEDPRYTHLKAGVLSDGLRAALGLKPNHLPPYIYQMRMLGYPPGHLENARQETSGLAMFGKHGREMTSAGETLEDGEVNEDAAPKETYDINRIIEYPGFNVEAETGTIDEWERFHMPAMQPHHSKEALKQQLISRGANVISGTKRQHSGNMESGSGHQKQARIETNSEDMDLDESVLHNDIEENSFAAFASDSNTSSPVVLLPDNEDQAVAIATDYESLPATPVFTTPVSKCGSVSFSLGTPIEAGVAASDTPHGAAKSLPDRSQFAKGVSDHILFENLPNATGTYRRLRKVLGSLHSSSPTSSAR